jgi:hypothetical protein
MHDRSHLRSQRRADRQRAIQRAARAYPQLGVEQHRKLAANRKPCSCWMCGNPRRYAKGQNQRTLQELRAPSLASSEH